jgi:hypothetical protein
VLSLLRACLLTATVVLVGNQVKAEERGPDDTASFLPYCVDHFDACRTSVIAENNVNMIAVMDGKHGCTFPRTPGQSYHDDTITVTKAILVWMNDHRAALKPQNPHSITSSATNLQRERNSQAERLRGLEVDPLSSAICSPTGFDVGSRIFVFA